MDRDNRDDRYKDNKEKSPNNNGWEQYSNKLGSKIDNFHDEEEFLDEINESLAKQISAELEVNNTNTKDKYTKKRRVPKGVKIFAVVFSIIMVLSALLMFTSGGRRIIINIAGKYIYDKFDYEDSNKNPEDSDTEEPDKQVVKKPVEHVVNILLLGVEEIGGASNTDLMMIATMNTKEKSLKLTSLMRDLYVQIPGYNNNKLNSVYAKGDVALLYETIDLNFGIHLDGYVMVNFSSFEKIVDLVGGVEVTLTNTEANYLNTTNYISNPAYRNVVAGKQTLNGNQALGYTRVRKVSTGTENNDFGRTQRHRAVLNAIFDKLKSKNVIQLGLLMNDIMNNVKINTDIRQNEFNNYLEEAVGLNVRELENHRIPSDGTWESVRVQIGKYNQDVLQPKDWEATKKEIREYIYGSDIGDIGLVE
jgi:LCP family protein required for cell wall assembly